MPSVPIEAVLKRDRAVVIAALAALTLLAWAYLLWLARGMGVSGATMADMPGMTMAPSLRPWTAQDFAFTFAMWAVMMVGMMIPSAAPMVLLYARVVRQAAQQGRAFGSTSWFLGGYVLSWILFSLLATLVQGILERAALLTPMMVAATPRIAGVILIGAGIYQWTALKVACLTECRSPLGFIQRHGGFRTSASGAVQSGFQHGLYCVGCCWALMALLFALGVMNILWIAAIAALVFVEKIIPGGNAIARIAGIAFVAIGVRLVLNG
jgi:predicted metal-binding membrane protein